MPVRIGPTSPLALPTETESMPAQLNHTIVWCRDKQASASFMAEILGRPVAVALSAKRTPLNQQLAKPADERGNRHQHDRLHPQLRRERHQRDDDDDGSRSGPEIPAPAGPAPHHRPVAIERRAERLERLAQCLAQQQRDKARGVHVEVG